MHSLMKTTSATALAIAAVCAFAGDQAAAQQTVRGQGATLPAGLYANWFNPSPTSGFTYSYNAARGATAANTGSGAGKSSFLSHSFNNAGVDLDVQFGGSDAILNSTELSNYASSGAPRWGQALQLPTVGTPVTIAYNPNGLTRTRSGPTGVVSTTGTQTAGPIIYLSRRSYCGIFTGAISNWNHPNIVADNGVAPSIEPIKVVVRSDSSGTTEIFTRHLATVCDGSAAAGGYRFAVPFGSATPPASAPTGSTTYAWSSAIPAARLIAVAGSGGVSTQIAANQYAIGYVSPDFTNVVATPAAGSGSPAPVPANLQNQADITAGTVNYTHSPAYPNVTTAQAGISAPTTADSALLWGQKLTINQAYNSATPSVDVRNNPTAAAAYPINGFTFLNFYTCYPTAKTAGARGLITYYTTANANADVEARADGFAPLASALKNAVRARAFATGTAPRGISSGPISGVCTL